MAPRHSMSGRPAYTSYGRSSFHIPVDHVICLASFTSSQSHRAPVDWNLDLSGNANWLPSYCPTSHTYRTPDAVYQMYRACFHVRHPVVPSCNPPYMSFDRPVLHLHIHRKHANLRTDEAPNTRPSQTYLPLTPVAPFMRQTLTRPVHQKCDGP